LFDIEVVDGLVAAFTPKEQTGKNLNLKVYAIDYDEAGAIFGSPYLQYTLYWRNGLYVGDVNPGDAPAQLDEHEIKSVGV